MNKSFFGQCRGAPGFLPLWAQSIGPEADSVGEEDLFEGPVLVGLEGGSGELFPGIIGFGISDPENEVMPIPVDEFIGLVGFGGSVDPIELEFLNLLHIVSISFR